MELKIYGSYYDSSHPIRFTVELSIKYICSPDKTDGEILISSYGCGYKTADLDFKETWRKWNTASKIKLDI